MPAKRSGQGGRPYRRLAMHLRATRRVCHICGLPIDMGLRAPHPMSWTADHLTPLAMGGSVSDPANLAPAHRVCNQRRGLGGRPGAPPADRSADW